MWHLSKDEKPAGYTGIIVYHLHTNKFYEGTWDEDIEKVIIDSVMLVELSNFDAWCYRKDLFKETGLRALLSGEKK